MLLIRNWNKRERAVLGWTVYQTDLQTIWICIIRFHSVHLWHELLKTHHTFIAWNVNWWNWFYKISEIAPSDYFYSWQFEGRKKSTVRAHIKSHSKALGSPHGKEEGKHDQQGLCHGPHSHQNQYSFQQRRLGKLDIYRQSMLPLYQLRWVPIINGHWILPKVSSASIKMIMWFSLSFILLLCCSMLINLKTKPITASLEKKISLNHDVWSFWCIDEFDWLIFCQGFSHWCSSGILPVIFFFGRVFVLFWFQGYDGLREWLWKCSHLFNL